MPSIKSTARVGAVSITDKKGRVFRLAPLAPQVPLASIRYQILNGVGRGPHEHDFAPLFDGAHIQVCACGAVLSQEEVYE